MTDPCCELHTETCVRSDYCCEACPALGEESYFQLLLAAVGGVVLLVLFAIGLS